MDVEVIYILLDNKPEIFLSLRGELFKYLVKVRRHQLGDIIQFRYKQEMDILYKYEIKILQNRDLQLEYISSEINRVKAKKSLHIAWCIIDSKSIEKVLPSLCEIGVEKISFIMCDRSQNNFKLDTKRFNRIIETSLQQSGRSTFIDFDTYKNIEIFIEKFPQTKIFDFSEKTLNDYVEIDTVLVGCEGGFSDTERNFLKTKDVFRLDTEMVLRSESAVVAVASKVLL